MLKLEGKMMNGLHSLGIKGEDMSKFLKLSVHSWDDTYALDILTLKLLVDLRLKTRYWQTLELI